MPRVYFTELQADIGVEAFYNMYVQYIGPGYDADMTEEERKKADACASAIKKLGGLV